VPVVGFIDDAGKRVKFADIASGKGEWWLPRPLLRALSRSYRSADHYGAGDVISVTTLGNPVQQIRLMQRHDVYVDPLRSLWAMHGTLAHAWLEAGLDPDSGNEVAERRLVIDFEGQLVGGTFDLIERDDPAAPWVGQDYKVLGGYKVAKMVNEGAVKGALEYVMQANVYRYMIARPDVREVIAGRARRSGHATMRAHGAVRARRPCRAALAARHDRARLDGQRTRAPSGPSSRSRYRSSSPSASRRTCASASPSTPPPRCATTPGCPSARAMRRGTAGAARSGATRPRSANSSAPARAGGRSREPDDALVLQGRPH
jgi:hypothetical protein